jgi:OOP family OmpA-OmpF porin
MKTILKIIVAIFIGVSRAFAGKNFVPAESPVTPVPQPESISPLYVGMGLVGAKFLADCKEVKGCKYEDVTYGLMARAGYDFNQYFGIEARYLRTLWDKGPFGGVPLEHYGLFLKPQYPIGDRVNIYGLLGYGHTKNRGNGARLNYFNSDSGFSAGIGLEIDFSSSSEDRVANAKYDREFDGHADQNKNWSFFIDYQRLLIKGGVADMDVVSAGVRYDF